MPVRVSKRGDRYRVVEADTNRIAKNASGTAVDGGGHRDRHGAVRQVRAMNSRSAKR